MRLYIDPGTGSMLFAILIGIIGAVTYMLKSWLLKLRFVLSGGKKVDTGAKKIPLVIFSDDKRYWSVFRPVCRELDKKGIDTVYMTASPDDPALENDLPHIHAQFIEEGNKAGIMVGMCGEAAADPLLIPVLLSFGLGEFSVSAPSILRTRRIISEWSKADADALTEKVMQLKTATEVKAMLQAAAR